MRVDHECIYMYVVYDWMLGGGGDSDGFVSEH
jgi:hypothetical protein